MRMKVEGFVSVRSWEVPSRDGMLSTFKSSQAYKAADNYSVYLYIERGDVVRE